ncbi:hypothetical protein HDU81_004762 [Chytriomyces hyalinus]|nr:hypothetical protein HDU81_004762 [Chytriomyces hyalinus]
MTVSTMGLNPINQYVLLRVCGMMGVGSDYKTCAANAPVQRQTAIWVQTMSLAVAIPSFFAAPLVGLLLDRLGRRRVLFMPLLAVLMPALAILASEYFQIQAALELLVLADLVKGLLGGNAVFVMAMYSMMADLTTGETRTRFFYLKEAFSLFGFSFGPFIGGLLYSNFGLSSVFCTIVTTELIVIFYVYNFIHETLPEANRKPLFDGTTSLNPLVHLSNSIQSLTSLFQKRTPTIFACVNAMGALTQSGYTFIFFFIPSKRFGWDSYESGRFLMVGSFCRFAYFAGIVPATIWRLHQGRDALGRINVELNLIRCGLLTYVVTLCAYGLASEGWQYYLIIPIYSFASSALPTLRSLLSKTIAADSQGQLFASLEVLQSTASLVSHIIMPAIFRSTVSYAPEAMCYVVAGMWGVALLGTFLVHSTELLSLADLSIL